MKFHDLTIGRIAAGLRAKEFSSEELVNHYIEQIGEKDGDLNSYVLVDEEGAIEAAKKVDRKLAAGEELSPLAGVPMGLKDLFNQKGVRTTSCSNFLRDFISPYDATVVSKLKDAGAVILGKQNMDEFACGVSTEHSCFGTTMNPHNLECVAGGSSGGSAAAVAADLCVYSLGTDTGGSIRQPASFCGVYGMKPTYGRVSRSGVNAMASSWDTIGPFARNVEDIAEVMQVISGHDAMDLTTPKVEVPDYRAFLDKGVKGMKIGLPKEYFGEGIEPEVSARVMDSVEKLAAAGAEVVEVSLPMTKYAVAVYYVSAPAELSTNLERLDGIRYGKKAAEAADLVDFYAQARGDGFGDEIKRRIMIGTYVLSSGFLDAYYRKAQKVRTLIIQEFEEVFKSVDVLIAPVSPFPAFKKGALIGDPLAMYKCDVLAIPASAAGLPALACPSGMTSDGLPVGLQIIGPQFSEGLCMQIAKAL